MKCMEINKRDFWYANYTGKEELVVDGKRTGQYVVRYSEPVKARAVISSARGSANDELFGISAEYDRTIVIDDLGIDISESSVLWLDSVGSAETPWDYVVAGIARSLNFVTIAVKRVKVK